MKQVSSCKITSLRRSEDDLPEIVESMLEKTCAEEYFFGYAGSGRVAWSVTVVDNELFARRSVDECGTIEVYYYSLPFKARALVRELYDTIAEDVAVYSFTGFLDPKEDGLSYLLAVFGRDYTNFLGRVMYFWRTILPPLDEKALAEEGYGH